MPIVERKAVSGIILILLLASMLTFTVNIKPAKSEPAAIIVPDDYPTIQEAIDHASDGDTIFVRDGRYYENIHMNKSICLVGENKHGTIIDGNFTGTVVAITADNVNVSNFTICNGEPHGHGVSIEHSKDCFISNNIITNSLFGIKLSESSNNTIADNRVFCPQDWMGVTLYFSDGNTLTNNTFSSGYVGILLSSANHNTLNNNKLYSNWFGIRLANSNNNTIVANKVFNNSIGIYIASYDSPGINNLVYHNNFVNNTEQAAESNSTNIWHSGYPSGGNYWSDYAGIDDYSGPNQDQLGDDGIGDAQYVIDYNNIDTYPLMGPWTRISGSLQILEPDDGSKMTGPATIIFVIENTGEDLEFLKGDADNRIDLEIEYRSAGGEIDGWGIMLWSTSYGGLTLSSEEKYEETLVYDPSKYKESVPPNFVGEAPFGEAIIRLVHWRSLEPEGYGIGEFGKAEIQVTFLSPAIVANLDFKPDTVKLKSKGRWIATYIELPEDYSVSDIDISTVELNGEIPAELHPTEIGDYDNDGVPDLMVKFSRQDLIAILSAGEAILTITGEVNGTSFEGTDTIRVMGK